MIAAAVLVLLAGAPDASALELAAQTALRPLIAAGALRVPASTGCSGLIVGVPHPTVGDYLAVALSGLDSGANRIAGSCDHGRCRVAITHNGGDDDLSSSEFRFTVTGGRLVPASLRCLSTP